eukprot:PLAT6910.1.p1 GENE.PLAT6910.1~~PLAT6910.1.p1  ORF type:complete len:211 (+),score=33.51 PLAT6910.1:43-675(+)
MMSRTLCLLALCITLLAGSASGLACSGMASGKHCSGSHILIGFYIHSSSCTAACSTVESTSCCVLDNYACYSSSESVISGSAAAATCWATGEQTVPPVPSLESLMSSCQAFCLGSPTYNFCMAACFEDGGSSGFVTTLPDGGRNGGKDSSSSNVITANQLRDGKRVEADSAADASPTSNNTDLALAATAGALLVIFVALLVKLVRARRAS